MADIYSSFYELSKSEEEGKNFAVEFIDRDSEITIAAIHGGGIEPGTDKIAKKIAADDYNLYIFEGRKPSTGGPSKDLHVTSIKFDDKRLLDLINKSGLCISIHGALDRGEDDKTLYMNGTNKTLLAHLKKGLEKNGFSVKNTSEIINAHNKENFISIPAYGGIQFELTAKFRERALSDSSFMDSFMQPIKNSIYFFKESSKKDFAISDEIGF